MSGYTWDYKRIRERCSVPALQHELRGLRFDLRASSEAENADAAEEGRLIRAITHLEKAIAELED